MKKTFCLLFAAVILFGGCKDEKHQPLPADAGAISGAAENACPERTVSLSIDAVADATSYAWYWNDEVLLDVSGASCIAMRSGSYTVAGKNTEGEGKRSPVHVVTITRCPGDDGEVPADAGAITGPEVSDCPSRTANLSVEPITGATSYLWSIAYAEDDIETVETIEPAYTADFSSITVEGKTVIYTVCGVNDAGVGQASPPHIVAKKLCVPEKPVIMGNPAWVVATRGDTVIYHPVCPATSMAGTVTCTSEGITGYKWFWQEVGVDPELGEWTTDGRAIVPLGFAGRTYNFAVVAINADGESPMSDVVQVTCEAECFQPNPPGTNVALYPDGFSPTAPPYSFGISNCDVQEKTFQSETSVVLACLTAYPKSDDHPVISYSYWVKITENGEFTRVFTSEGPGFEARKIRVDGITYPSGTYRVTAASDHGDSEFGANEITVNIRTDCPNPPALDLPAPTFTPGSGATISNGVLQNTCPTPVTDIYLTIPSGIAGSVTDIKWSRITTVGGTPETVAQGSDQMYLLNLTPANNGTYSVTYTKKVGGTDYESPAGTIVISMKLCAPAFTTKPTVIVDEGPGSHAVAVLAAPNTHIAPLITGYEWYYNGTAATSAEVTTDPAPRTYRLFKEGTYTVKAKSAYGDSPFSEEIVLTKQTETPPSSTYTRDELVGTYNVADHKAARPNYESITYTMTITAGSSDNAIVITGMGDKQDTPVNATVSTTGDVTTITIQKQGTTRAFAKVLSYNQENGIVICDPDPLVITLTTIGGQPGVSQSMLYGIGGRSRDICDEAYLYGHASNVTTWTKQ